MTIEQAIDKLVEATGKAGPFILGSYECALCEHIGRAVVYLDATTHPYTKLVKCKNCGQKEGTFLNLNGDGND